jgi:capsular polysaccharide biosynthesis protein
VKADAFAAETRAELALAAPDFDLKGLAERGRRLSLLTHVEAEDLALRARFPDWLANRIRTAADEPEMPGDVFQLLEPHLCSLMPAKGDYSPDSVLSGFRPGHAVSPHIIRVDGGASVHYVANFRKLSWSADGLIAPLIDSNARVLLPFLREARPVPLDGRTFLAVVEGSSVFTHWILDTLPRLLLVLEQEGPLDRYDHFLFATDQPKFHRFTLQALGIDPTRVVTRQRHGSLFSVDSFTYVSAPRQHCVAHPHIYDMVTAFFLPDMAPVIPSRRLYISRHKAQRRRILNEPEMFAALEARGFEILHLEDLTIAETARALRSATHIVAVHGAGLANLIFCQPGTRVLEIHSAHLSRDYWMIANQRGLDYFGFEACGPSGKPIPPADRAAMGFFDRNGLDMHVPMGPLLSLVDRAFLCAH